EPVEARGRVEAHDDRVAEEEDVAVLDRRGQLRRERLAVEARAVRRLLVRDGPGSGFLLEDDVDLAHPGRGDDDVALVLPAEDDHLREGIALRLLEKGDEARGVGGAGGARRKVVAVLPARLARLRPFLARARAPEARVDGIEDEPGTRM